MLESRPRLSFGHWVAARRRDVVLSLLVKEFSSDDIARKQLDGDAG
jgi:hypothetical protein